jgi:hypothetical protein
VLAIFYIVITFLSGHTTPLISEAALLTDDLDRPKETGCNCCRPTGIGGEETIGSNHDGRCDYEGVGQSNTAPSSQRRSLSRYRSIDHHKIDGKGRK